MSNSENPHKGIDLNDPSQVTQLINQNDPTKSAAAIGLTKKTVSILAAVAVAGSAIAYSAIKKASALKDPVVAAQDTSSALQTGRNLAAGFGKENSNRDNLTPTGLPPSNEPIDTNTEAGKMKMFQEQLRQNALASMANRPGDNGSPQAGQQGPNQVIPGQPNNQGQPPLSGQPGPNGPSSNGQTVAGQNQAGRPVQNQSNQRTQAPPQRGYVGSGMPVHRSILPADLQRRFDPDYEKWLAFQNTPAIVYSRGGSGIAYNTTTNGNVAGVDPSLQNLVDGQGNSYNQKSNYFAAGTEIRAVTNQVIQTDYPSSVSASIIAPQELAGSTLILNYSGVTIDRASASLGPLVVSKNGVTKQYSITGVVRMDLPMLSGEVDHHYARRIVPLIANAGIAGAAVALSNNQSANNGISTKDQIYNNMLISGLNGVQAEIGKVNQGKPEVTVTVPSGQEFTVMLTQGFELK